MSARKTNEEKRRLGTPGKRPLPEVVNFVPPVDRDLAMCSPVEIFDHLLRVGSAHIADTDAIAMALLREILEERDEIKRLLAEKDPNTKRQELRATNALILDILKEQGLTAISRSRLGIEEVQAVSSIEQMRLKREAASRSANATSK